MCAKSWLDLPGTFGERLSSRLCEELDKAYLLELEHHPFSKEVEEILSKEDCKDPYEVSKAPDREKENEQCIGGLRRDNSVQKVPIGQTTCRVKHSCLK